MGTDLPAQTAQHWKTYLFRARLRKCQINAGSEL